LDNPNDSEDDCAADDVSDIEHNNGIEDLEFPEHQDVNAARNVTRLVQPTWKSKKQTEQVLVMVNAIEMRTDNGVKKKKDRMHQWFISFFM
jgi:hypothetical protein